jgi:Ala-tRNA(Pro) deacylase
MKTLTGKDRLEGFLRKEGVPFQTHSHAPVYTAQEMAEVEKVPGLTVAKVVMVEVDGQLAMTVIPAPYRLDTKKVKAAIGADNVRLAHEDEFSPAFGGIEVGAMPPFGDFGNVPTYVDKSLAEDEYIVFQAGTHTDTIQMKYADYERIAQPIVVDIAFRH